jgi:catechol 2,3-dioxygenase-like lactoylglutathione lyase family enzyme
VSDGVVVNHVGLCVTDLERSRRFYVEALGFEHQRDLRPPDAACTRLLDVAEPVGLTASYLTRGSFVLELLHYERDGNPEAAPRVMNEPGLTHLSFTTDDLPAALEAVRRCGGEVIESSDLQVAIMVRDPDGQLLELLTSPPSSAG